MDDSQTLRSMVRDDLYHVERVLADGPTGRTELVTLDGEGPMVRKRIPEALANATAWATMLEIDDTFLPHIETLYRMPDELVVVYDYVEGPSLAQQVTQQGRLDEAHTVQMMRDLCHAVGVLHAHGVVHRDITPGNVILAADGAHLIDLGIARRAEPGRERDTHLLGTWGFAAPEQYGFASSDARTDVYALGKLLGYALTGVLPDDKNFEASLADASRVSPSLADVVARATSFEPSARYQSADELADAVLAARKGPVDRYTFTSAVAPETKAAPAAQPNPAMKAAPAAKAAPASASAPQPRPATQTVPATQQRTWVHEQAAPKTSVFANDTAAHGRASAAPASAHSAASSDMQERSFSQAPLGERVVAIILWVVAGLWCLLILTACLSLSSNPAKGWGVSENVMGAIMIAGCAWACREVFWLVTRKGRYQRGAHPYRTAITRIVVCALATLALMAVVGGALEKLFPSPRS